MGKFELTVGVLFRLINFGVFIALLVYLFRRYVLTGIAARYAQQLLERKTLANRSTLLRKQKRELTATIEDDTWRCDQLKKQIAAWKRVVDKQDEERAKKFEVQLQEMRKRVTEQDKKLAIDTARRAILPETLETLQRELTQEFTSDAQQKEYLRKIFSSMRGKGGT